MLKSGKYSINGLLLVGISKDRKRFKVSIEYG